MPVPFVALLVIVVFAVIAVALGASIAMVGYGLLKTTAKFSAFSTIDIPNTPPVPAPGTWAIQYSKNVPAQMTKANDGSYFVDLPLNQDGLHYVVQRAPTLQLGQLVTLSFQVTGSGTVVPVQGTTATVSLFMQRKDDNMSGTGQYQQYRYWHAGAKMTDTTLSATLTPDQWTDVFGKRGTDYPNQFADCVANAVVIGFTFGDPGAGATGHGVYVKDGTARFTLKSFTIA